MLKLSILAVDDSPVITEMIRDAFESEGYRVMVAEDGAQALKTALNEHPDLIIADIAMPGMDGWDLCGQIRSNPFTSFIPFIFLTTRTEAPDRIRGLQMGADDYLTKPFEMDELIARVQLIFQRMRTSQEALLVKDRNKTLSGHTSEMALPDLLQMFSVNQKTGLLRISKVGMPTGKIGLEKGSIIWAEFGRARGEKALYRMLTWEDAHFDVEPLMRPERDPGLPGSVEASLIEGMRQIDERSEMEKEFKLAGKKLKLVSRPAESGLSPREAQLIKTVESARDVGEVLEALAWTDFDIYRMIVYFIRKGVIGAE
jgi:CheY-like chemotaxis protein